MDRLLVIASAGLLLAACGGAAPSQAAEAAAEPVPVCSAGDGRTEIPVWQPELDEDGNLSSEPPQQDGQLVYIRLQRDASAVACDDEALVSFNHPSDVDDFRAGGLAVNVRGNTRLADGACHFSGYYRNGEVPGMHQGWLETYFEAVDEGEIAAPGEYCLARAVD